MRRRALALVCALSLTLSGCSAVLEGEYSSSVPHESSVSWDLEQLVTVTVSNRDALYDAVCSFVEDGVERGIVRFDAYTGDVEGDLSEVCLTVASDTPLGAYTVYYIAHSLSQIVSFYEAEVTVVYKRPRTDADTILETQSKESLRARIETAMRNNTEQLTLLCDGETLDADDVMEAVDSVYYDDPVRFMYYPGCTVERYPEDGDACILDISLSSPYSASTVDQRREQTTAAAGRLLSRVTGTTDEECLRQVCEYLSREVQYDQEQDESESYSRWYNSFTAYGALVLHRAVGEGYAIAVKLICDELGIECIVVRGKRSNVNHAWNIVKLPEGYFHMDVSQYAAGQHEDGEEDIFFCDSQIQNTYWWDVQDYPACPIPLGGLEDDPSILDNPDTPGNQDVPDTPDDPGNGDNLDNPDDPNYPNDPVNPDDPDDPDAPGDPNGADEPSVPGSPDDPDDPESPDNSEIPDESDEPDVSDDTATPDNPDDPENTDNPDPTDGSNGQDNTHDSEDPDTTSGSTNSGKLKTPGKTDDSGNSDGSGDTGTEDPPDDTGDEYNRKASVVVEDSSGEKHAAKKDLVTQPDP